jgi:excisionase family DNA binding protein
MVQTADELLTVKEAARLLKVSPYTVYRWISAGRLNAVRYSPRVLRLRRSDLESVRVASEPESDDPPRGSPAAILSIAGILPDPEFAAIMDEIVRNRAISPVEPIFADEQPSDELPG